MSQKTSQWVCRYFYEFVWEDFCTYILEIKRLNVPKDKPAERFMWLRLYVKRNHTSCWSLRFLARGKTVDGEAYRILENGNGQKELYILNDTSLTVDGVALKRRDPATLSEHVRERIDAYLEQQQEM